MLSLKHSLAGLLTTMALVSWHPSSADETLTIGYNIKPPLFYSERGQAQGLVVERARSICERSGVTCTFEELPFLRIMAYLQTNRPNFAALGLSKTEERVAISVFSEPIYQDQPPVLVIKQSAAPKFKQYRTFVDMLKSQQFVFGAKKGNAYPIDAQLNENHARREESTVDTPGLLKMLQLGRFDYLMVYPEEYEWIKQTIINPELSTLRYPDMPLGNHRYLLFSKATPQAIIAKINAAVKSGQENSE